MSENKKAPAGAGTPAGVAETAACSGAAISCPHLITLESPRQVVAAALLAGAENAIEGAALATTLGFKDVGDSVNLETDIIGKYVEQMLKFNPKQTQEPALNKNMLLENGFI
mgnify:CR=1 FL=1